LERAAVRVVFTDKALAAVCSQRQRIASRWGDSACDVELALCALRASSDLRKFLGMPNVTQEDDEVIFTAQNCTVWLSLDGVELEDRTVCVISALRVRDERHG
jgi:hypothetical protein